MLTARATSISDSLLVLNALLSSLLTLLPLALLAGEAVVGDDRVQVAEVGVVVESQVLTLLQIAPLRGGLACDGLAIGRLLLGWFASVLRVALLFGKLLVLQPEVEVEASAVGPKRRSHRDSVAPVRQDQLRVVVAVLSEGLEAVEAVRVGLDAAHLGAARQDINSLATPLVEQDRRLPTVIDLDVLLQFFQPLQDLDLLLVELRVRGSAKAADNRAELLQISQRKVVRATVRILFDRRAEEADLLKRCFLIDQVGESFRVERQVVARGSSDRLRVQVVWQINRPASSRDRDAELGIGLLTDDLGGGERELFTQDARRLGQRARQLASPDHSHGERQRRGTRLGQSDQLNLAILPLRRHRARRLVANEDREQFRLWRQLESEELSRAVLDRVDRLPAIRAVSADDGRQIGDVH